VPAAVLLVAEAESGLMNEAGALTALVTVCLEG
jgi:hypothetical protein